MLMTKDILLLLFTDIFNIEVPPFALYYISLSPLASEVVVHAVHSASEMTCIVSDGALNYTHALTPHCAV